jgi:hypothetical protein
VPTWRESATVFLIDLVTLGMIRSRRQRRYETLGDFTVWPFIRRADYEAALRDPRLLAGVDAPKVSEGASNEARVTGTLKIMVKKVIIALVLLAATVFAVWAWLDMKEARTIHASNLIRTEQFKRQFDQDVKIGTSLASLEEYLRSKPVKAERSYSIDKDGREIVSLLRIEVFNERSPVWGCGRYSVGILAEIVDDRLKSAEVSEWSFDCV